MHHPAAAQWLAALGEESHLYFCRFTHLGLLRLLSTVAVMGAEEVLGQPAAWQAYDRWLRDDRVSLLPEPAGLEQHFRGFSRAPQPAPKDWADSYLAAFAQTAGLKLVTFDRTLSRRLPGSICVRPAGV
ncbi:MAG: TA system VapC family ribonuclease toxin [Terriglobales bacterium]